jgi:hypothetical protein
MVFIAKEKWKTLRWSQNLNLQFTPAAPQHVSPQVVKFFTADDNGVCCSKTRLSQHRSHFIETGDLLAANQELKEVQVG